MSHSPVGYQPRFDFMPYYSGVPAELLVPARKASWFMIALAGLLLVIATCNGGMVLAADEAVLAERLRQVQKQYPSPLEISPAIVRAAQVTMAVLASLYGLALLGLAVQARRGTLPWLIASIVGVGIGLLFLAFFFLVALIGGPAAVLEAAALFIVPVLLMGLSLRWLFRAMANVSAIEAHEQEQEQIARMRSRTTNMAPGDGDGVRA